MGNTILIVDDSATVRQQLKALLADHGLDGIEARDAASALETARRRRVDLFIVDVNMPGVNGLELVRMLRREPVYADVPIFVLTSESTPDSKKMGKEVGATAWIVKPFDGPILLKGIRKVLTK